MPDTARYQGYRAEQEPTWILSSWSEVKNTGSHIVGFGTAVGQVNGSQTWVATTSTDFDKRSPSPETPHYGLLKEGPSILPRVSVSGEGMQRLARHLCLPFDTGFNHVTCHQLQPLFQVLSKLFFGPVQVPNEGLKGIEFPEQIFGSA